MVLDRPSAAALQRVLAGVAKYADKRTASASSSLLCGVYVLLGLVKQRAEAFATGACAPASGDAPGALEYDLGTFSEELLRKALPWMLSPVS